MARTLMWTRSIGLLLLMALLSLSSAATTCAASDAVEQEAPALRPTVAAEVGDLKLQLEKGLRARRPQEFEFVEMVVTMVSDDTLPLDLVKRAFLWARKKATTVRYPFPYFERALRELATKQGIKIP